MKEAFKMFRKSLVNHLLLQKKDIYLYFLRQADHPSLPNLMTSLWLPSTAVADDCLYRFFRGDLVISSRLLVTGHQSVILNSIKGAAPEIIRLFTLRMIYVFMSRHTEPEEWLIARMNELLLFIEKHTHTHKTGRLLKVNMAFFPDCSLIPEHIKSTCCVTQLAKSNQYFFFL